MKLIDITGQRFGRLTVLCKLPPRLGQNGGSLWRCRCDCGNECERISSAMRSAGTPSCGCYAAERARLMGANREFIAKRAEGQIKHGAKRRTGATSEYKTWLGMKRRCYDTKCKDYKNWGGRGIRVCAEWLDDFAAFLRDMGPLPSPDHTIDRLDSNADYSPTNCRWATPEQQGGENRRGFVAVTVSGQRFEKIADACRAFGVSATTVNERLKAGIPVDEAFTPGRLKSRRSPQSYWRKDLRPQP